MINTDTTEGTRDLLAAIAEALTVPVADYGDRDRELRLLRNRTADIAGVLAGIVEDGATASAAAEVLRRATSDEPVTYSAVAS